jgi:hypothetical protein
MKLTKGVTVGNDIFNLGILRVDSRIGREFLFANGSLVVKDGEWARGIYNQWDRE